MRARPVARFGRCTGLGGAPAVVVIDVIIGFTDERRPLGAPTEAAIASTRRLLDAARAAGIPDYFSSVQYEDDSLWSQKIDSLGSIRMGSGEGAVDPSLGRREGEAVVLMERPSTFSGTDFHSRLNAAQIDTLLIAGCTTNGCTRATVINALSNGFRPMAVRVHAQSLIDLDDTYADVVSFEDAREHVATVRHDQPYGAAAPGEDG